MIEVDNIYCGWVNTNIHYIIKKNPNIISSHSVVLITSIDSLRDVAKSTVVQRICEDSTLHAKIRGNYLSLLGSEITSLVDNYDLFNGFDEIWCFSSEPSMIKPESVSIVMPPKISDRNLQELTEWMQASGCRLGLGDGEGLNYITTSTETASAIENIACHT